MSLVCRKCNDNEKYLQEKGMQIGAYCKNCGAWLKWVGKKELPIYKNRGARVYPQGVTVPLKMSALPKESLLETSDDIGVITDEGQDFNNIAKEGKKYKEEETAQIKIGKEQESTKNTEEYCPVCTGTPIQLEPNAKVDVFMCSDLVTITDINGTNVLGFIKAKYCIECGKYLG